MKIQKQSSWTVLVYTLVLVVLWVFMAAVVLNIATELSLEYDNRNIEVTLVNTIETKWDLAMKYARDLNDTGSGFIDNIWCPTSITMSGSTAATTWFSSTIRYSGSVVYCEWTHNGNPVSFYFNSDYTDLWFANYEWSDIGVNSSQQTGTFTDADGTYLDITSSYPLTPDNMDDNFDSDDYSVYSTWAMVYPDWYVDNDAEAKLLTYGYVLRWAGLYNMFWSNKKMQEYIDQNAHNDDPVNAKIWDVSAARLYLDMNRSFKLILYEIDDEQYLETHEFVAENVVTGTGQFASIWYLQDDLSLSSTITGNEFIFDFVNNDYALFAENTSSGSLLYRVSAEEIATGSGIYITPLQDDDTSIFSYLWGHIFVNERWYLIWSQYEVFGLK